MIGAEEGRSIGRVDNEGEGDESGKEHAGPRADWRTEKERASMDIWDASLLGVKRIKRIGAAESRVRLLLTDPNCTYLQGYSLISRQDYG